jgi:hypothetical protein
MFFMANSIVEHIFVYNVLLTKQPHETFKLLNKPNFKLIRKSKTAKLYFLRKLYNNIAETLRI